MSNREKIIIGLTILVAIYGVYSLFFEGKDDKSGQKAAVAAQDRVSEVQAFAADITAKLAKRKVASAVAPYIVARASADWSSDPFMEKESVINFEAEKVQEETPEFTNQDLGLTYSGYLTAGSKSLAVINGVEYEEGERLDREGGYIVKSITPIQVVIGREGSTSKVIIPLEETEF